MSASEKVAWDKTRVDLATVAPEFKTLSDVSIAGKMMDREWVASAISKAREKAQAFEQIAQRANDAQASRSALASRERLMDLVESLQDKLSPRPTSEGLLQGPKTRAFQRGLLTP